MAQGAQEGAGRNACSVVTLDGVNHLLVPATTGELDEYPTLATKVDRSASRENDGGVVGDGVEHREVSAR